MYRATVRGSLSLWRVCKTLYFVKLYAIYKAKLNEAGIRNCIGYVEQVSGQYGLAD